MASLTSNSKNIQDHLTNYVNCLSLLSSGYAVSLKEDTENLQRFLFASSIVEILVKNINLINYASSTSKEYFLDSLKTHCTKYTNNINTSDVKSELIEGFHTNISLLCNQLNYGADHNYTDTNRDSEELENIKYPLTQLLEKASALFGEQSYNQEAIDRLQAMSIAYNSMHNNQNYTDLINQLLLIKELWVMNHNKFCAENNRIFFFHTNLKDTINQLNLKHCNSEEILSKLVELLIDQYKVLNILTDHELATLYDRLKNLEFSKESDSFHNTIEYILQKIYTESQLRYNYNNIRNSSYELIKRFEDFDAAIYQIETSEFFIVEAFLVSPHTSYINEVYNFCIKHTDTIKVIFHNDLTYIQNIITRLRKYVQNTNNQEMLSKLNALNAKITNKTFHETKNRYSSLDNFAKHILHIRYSKLFEDIDTLWPQENNEAQNNQQMLQYKFLQRVVTDKIAKDYPISISYNSLDKMRNAIKDRQLIADSLQQINFSKLLHNNHKNNITHLHFKKQITLIHKNHHPIVTASDYIKAYLQVLVSNCTTQQLEIIYASSNNQTEVQTILKQEILRQIKQRTRVSKMLYFIITGKRSELAKLKQLKKLFQLQQQQIPEAHPMSINR